MTYLDVAWELRALQSRYLDAADPPLHHYFPKPQLSLPPKLHSPSRLHLSWRPAASGFSCAPSYNVPAHPAQSSAKMRHTQGNRPEKHLSSPQKWSLVAVRALMKSCDVEFVFVVWRQRRVLLRSVQMSRYEYREKADEQMALSYIGAQ